MRGCVTDWRQKANEHTSKHECIRRPASLALHIVWGRVLPGTGFLNPGLEMGFRNDTAQQNPLRPVAQLHRRCPWVPGGTVPQSLMHRMVCLCTAKTLGLLEALFHRALCTEWFATAPQGPLGSWRHCSTEPFARKGCRCSARANDHGKANAYGGPPFPGPGS